MEEKAMLEVLTYTLDVEDQVRRQIEILQQFRDVTWLKGYLQGVLDIKTYVIKVSEKLGVNLQPKK